MNILQGIKTNIAGLKGITMEQIYSYVGVSRQAYAQALTRRKKEETLMDEISIEVNKYRRLLDAYAGSRSLYYNLGIKRKYNLGVNKFESLLSGYGLTLSRVSTIIVTTRSSPRSWLYDNLINGLIINDINQVMVGDLTYVLKDSLRYFVFSLFDLYSARMLGIYSGQRMRAIEAIKPLEQSVELRGIEKIKGCIHHTDGGSQYFSDLYLKKMVSLEMLISVANNCLENGFAEQRNGMIKNHFIPLKRGRNEDEFNKGLQEIKMEYNYNRKQENLGWMSPVEFEQSIQQQGTRQCKQLPSFNLKTQQ